ncbi:T9SS type A sorting domain-containing protein [Candidatus Kapabacteria bacterium]|nr:T9SS type A sorting domain-containing protein [Candidatus Kapabacteria bacterium]
MKILITAFLCYLSVFSQSITHEQIFGTNSNGSDVKSMLSGNILLTGVNYDGPNGLSDIYLVKLDKYYNTIFEVNYGGFNNDWANSSIELEDESILVVGGTGSFSNSQSRDLMIVKFDSLGNFQQRKVYGGNNTDIANDLIKLKDGFLVTGYTESYGSGDRDAWVLRLDENLDTLWTKTFGGDEFDDSWSVKQVNDNFYITGGSYSYASGDLDDAWLIKFNSFGETIWIKHYGVENRIDWAWDMDITIDEEIILVGLNDSQESDGVPFGKLHLIKVDSDGEIIWDKSYGQENNFRIEGTGVKTSSNGDIYISGWRVNYSLAAVTFYMAKFDKSGEVIWEQDYFKSNEFARANGVSFLEDNKIAYLGYSGQSQGSPQKMTLIVLDDLTSGINSHNEVPFFPNPSSSIITIDNSNKYTNFEIYNYNGEKIDSGTIKTNFIDITKLKIGSYFLKLSNSNSSTTIKFLKS